MRYLVGKEVGSKSYFVYRNGRGFYPFPERYESKKKALKAAAKMSGMEYKEFMKEYRKESNDNL